MRATHELNLKAYEWREEFIDHTDGLGSEADLDYGSSIIAMLLAVEPASRHGQTVITSDIDKIVPLNALDIMNNEKEIIGTVGQHQLREFKWAF